MKSQIKKTSDTLVKMTVSLGSEELASAKQLAINHLAKDVEAKGFRKGKVPAEIARKHIEPARLDDETINRAISDALVEIFETNKMQAIDRPKIEVKKYLPDNLLEFTVEVEIMPEVKLADYKKLKTKPKTVKLDDEEIDQVLSRVQNGMAESKEVKRPAKMGDEVVIDFKGEIDGKAFEGGESKDYHLTLGSNQFIKGFEQGIVGHKSGDKFDLDLQFPKDYHADNLKSKKVVFKVALNKVLEIKLPNIDDELAKKAGPFKNLSELKDDIKKGLLAQKQHQIQEEYRNNLASELADGSRVSLPEALVEDQQRFIEQDFVQNLSYHGQTLDQYLKFKKYSSKQAWIDKEVKPVAEKRLKVGLVLAEVSKIAGIKVSEDDIESRLSLYKQQYGQTDMAGQLDKPEVRHDIASRLITEKTMDYLVSVNQK